MFKFPKMKFNENKYKKYENVKISKSKKSFKAKWVNNFKLLMKDLKRTRWTNLQDSYKTFLKVALFIIIISLALFGIAIAFSSLWNVLGVGIGND